MAEGLCRFDPGFVIGELDDRLPPRSVCVPGRSTLCLHGGRFRVDVTWQDFAGVTGQGRAVPQTADTGCFWFFEPDNVELMVKVLDGRQINGHLWVFYGSLSNVAYELTVTDTLTLEQRVYRNPMGAFASRGHTDAF